MTAAARPRVLHIVPALFGREGIIGGAERYARELAGHMAAVTPTMLLAFGASDAHALDGDLRIRTLGRPWLVRGQRANPFSLRALPEIAHADVVHCHQQHVLMSSTAAATARVLRRRVFCSDLGGGGWDVSVYVSTDSWFHGHLHLSEYSLRTAGHTNRRTASVIYGGVDTDRFSPDGDVARDIDCLFVGRMLPHKGVDVLIEAVPADIATVLIGPAPDSRYLAHLRRLADGKTVIFRHDCDDDELVRAYRRARCVVLPSVYRDCYGGTTAVPELLGQTMLEAMACEAPVVCTNVASLPEVVEHERSGLIVPERDIGALRRAILQLQGLTATTAEMGRRGRQRVLERFTWAQVVDRCLKAYVA